MKMFALRIIYDEDMSIARKIARAFGMVELKGKNLFETPIKGIAKNAQGQCSDFGIPLENTRIWEKEAKV